MKKRWKALKTRIDKALFRTPDEMRRNYTPGEPLATGGDIKELLYAANPVYIEVSQTGSTPMMGLMGGFMALVGVAGLGMGGTFLWTLITEELSLPKLAYHFEYNLDLLFGLIFGLFGSIFILFFGVIGTLTAYLSLVTPVDATARFDRKRQLVYLKRGRNRVLAIPWANLTPVVTNHVASAYLPNSLSYQGKFVEYDENGEPKETNGIEHSVAIGNSYPAENGSLMEMEGVRQYMESGYSPMMRPLQWRKLRRPGWRVMFDGPNFVKEFEDLWENPKRPRESMFIIIAPLFIMGSAFFFHFINAWNLLAQWVAPFPKWPRALREQHEADLLELGIDAHGNRLPRPKRKPVVRLNGELVEAASEDREAGEEAARQQQIRRREAWRDIFLDRLAACVALPLAPLSMFMIWGVLITGDFWFETLGIRDFSAINAEEFVLLFFGGPFLVNALGFAIAMLTAPLGKKTREWRDAQKV
ncbi:MAG: hypothetical protein LBQ81_03025, partial [Zoogloeaceae bacterium]|nr:hypothetical protein [Zoogloeaceae bacterium]